MTLLIKNVVLLGAGARSGEHADVFISGARISAIGNFPTKRADEVIDGRGAYLSPGFIDVDTTADHYLTLVKDPGLPDFLRQGVTSIVGGQCGASLAPLIYGELTSIRKWADISGVNIDWHSMAEFSKIAERKRLGVNFATFAGHSTIRRAIVGDEPRALTKNELNVFGQMLKIAMQEGALGLSLGLSYLHGRNATLTELKFLAGIVKDNGGILGIHLREEDLRGVGEAIEILKSSRVRMLINHFIPLRGKVTEYDTALKAINDLPQDLDCHFDVRIEEGRAASLYMLLPEWAQKWNLERMAITLEDEWLAKKIIRDIKEENGEDIVVKEAPRNEIFVGKTLRDLGEIFGKRDYKETLFELMKRTGLKAVLSRKNIDLDALARAIPSSRALIGSHASGEEIPPSVAFPRFLGFALESEMLTLREAIEKITALPAKKFGFVDRGVIAEGNYADLVGFTFGNDPNGKKMADVELVIVNGVVALQEREVVSLQGVHGHAGHMLHRG